MGVWAHLRRAVQRLNAKRDRRFFYDQTVGIWDTPPLTLKDGDVPLTIITQLQASDVQPYLICIKALYRRIGFGRVMVLADRMTEADKATIAEHIPGVRFQDVADITPGTCQKGGTWERLWTCVEASANSFVIQMDSDVLALGRLQAVGDAVRSNTAFALGGRMQIEPASAYVARGHALATSHINIETERAFAQYPGAERVHYIRASSGFAGFARGGVNTDLIEDFHAAMVGILGARWREWGTEQVASNFAIANTPGAVRLPFPAYANFLTGMDEIMAEVPTAEALHFLGAHRYERDAFVTMARAEIAALNQQMAG